MSIGTPSLQKSRLTCISGETEMKFGIVALDYDGTIAVNGTLDSSVRTAVDELRGRGIIAVLVTGRTLEGFAPVYGGPQAF